MKKRCIALVCALVLTALGVACVGAYLKYEILLPMEMCLEDSIMEIPFLVHSDAGLRYMVSTALTEEEAAILEQETTEAAPAETETTEPETTAPLVTEPPTEPETLPEVTEPVYVTVDESWFDDALFIGNSLVVGLRDYARLGEAQYFCSVGMSVFDVFDYWLSDRTFWKTNLQGLLQTRTYGKIYIHFGTNETGKPTDVYLQKYQQMLNTIREWQPEAVIIIHGTITVGEAKTRKMPYLNPEKISEMNAGIAAMAEDDSMRYVDFNEYIAQEDGFLPASWSSDGCHPTAEGYREWAQWIWDNACYLDIPAPQPDETPETEPQT